MGKLKTELGIQDPDDFYAKLIDLHKNLTPEESNKLNAKMILLLANQVGDVEVLAQVLEYARESLQNS